MDNLTFLWNSCRTLFLSDFYARTSSVFDHYDVEMKSIWKECQLRKLIVWSISYLIDGDSTILKKSGQQQKKTPPKSIPFITVKQSSFGQCSSCESCYQLALEKKDGWGGVVKRMEKSGTLWRIESIPITVKPAEFCHATTSLAPTGKYLSKPVMG